MNTPLVSIIIPTYNRAHLIGETLDSVLAQTYPNWECIIVDDGSTDNTKEVIDEYILRDIRFQYHQRPKDRLKGGNAARNYGFEISKGDYVNWFDDDDTMGELFISDKLKAIDENTVIVVGSGYFCDENLRVVKKMRHDYTYNLLEDFLLWKAQIITNSVMIRSNFLLGKKIFEEWIVRGQETEFFSRLFYKIDNEKVVVVDSFQFYHRNHLDRKSSKDLVYNPENYKCTGYIYLSNYDRVKELQNEILINLFHNRIISLWFRHLKYGDYKNLKKLETQFLKKIKEKKINYLMIKFSFFLCGKLNIQSTKIKNFLKK